IAAEAGSVLKAHARTGDPTLAAVRGPRPDAVREAKFVIPAGTGIAGFCATQGVSLALSDVQKDPRYFAAVSEKVNYETRSVLCCPMIEKGRVFGCMQIVNRREEPVFPAHEVGLLAYLAHQGARYLSR